MFDDMYRMYVDSILYDNNVIQIGLVRKAELIDKIISIRAIITSLAKGQGTNRKRKNCEITQFKDRHALDISKHPHEPICVISFSLSRDRFHAKKANL